MESNFEWITANGDIGIRFFHSIDDGGFGPVNFQTPEYVDYLDAADYAHDMIGNLNAGMNRWIDWNFLVDKDGGPRHVPMGFTSGLIVDDDFHYRNKKMPSVQNGNSLHRRHFCKIQFIFDRNRKNLSFSLRSKALPVYTAHQPEALPWPALSALCAAGSPGSGRLRPR